MKISSLTALLLAAVCSNPSYSQALRIPQNTNYIRMTGARVGVTEIKVHYSALVGVLNKKYAVAGVFFHLPPE